MKLFVVNVGVNTSHASRQGLRSPILPDRTFEFLPIPEDRCPTLATLPRYSDLSSRTRTWPNLGAIVPVASRSRRVHADPDFDFMTYGDVLNSRAAALEYAAAGDQVWFLARLWANDRVNFTGASAFHFVANFEVDKNLLLPPDAAKLTFPVKNRVTMNPHWKRMDDGHKDTFRIIVANQAESHRFVHAIEVTPSIAAHIYAAEAYDPISDEFVVGTGVVKNKNGRPRKFQAFGSVTRAVQVFLNSENADQRPHLGALMDLATQAGAIE